MNREFLFFIQARTQSTRLPEKVLIPIYEGRSILEIIIDSLTAHFPDIPIIVCTSTNEHDNKIEVLSRLKNVSCFRGDETNVLQRFVDASNNYISRNIIRVCADNPFLYPPYIKELIDLAIKNPKYDYYSYVNNLNIPIIKTHWGLFVEVVKKEALNRALELTKKKEHQEHVTSFIYSSSKFLCFFNSLPKELEGRKLLRFTIDNIEDFRTAEQLMPLYRGFGDLSAFLNYVESKDYLIKSMSCNINKYEK